MSARLLISTLRLLRWLEDGLLVLLLAAMIGLSTAQILLRNLFESGLPWADPLLRLLVLWLALAGALAAARDDRHIRIDLLSRFLTKTLKRTLDRLAALFTALICATLTWQGGRLVWSEYQDGTSLIAGIPGWVAQLVIPLGFGLMALRFALLAWRPPQAVAPPPGPPAGEEPGESRQAGDGWGPRPGPGPASTPAPPRQD